MKRTPFRRKSWFRGRRSRIKPRSTKRHRPAEYSDPAYIAWLKGQGCRVTGVVGGNTAHHLRHTATGAPMGGHVKDDRRAITLDPSVHVQQFHGLTGYFKGWTKAKLQAWENEQLKIQRAQFLQLRAPNSAETAHL